MVPTQCNSPLTTLGIIILFTSIVPLVLLALITTYNSLINNILLLFSWNNSFNIFLKPFAHSQLYFIFSNNTVISNHNILLF